MFQRKRFGSVRLRWLIWRARLSVPSLLASDDERRVISRVAAINGGIAIVIIGLFAWFVELPLVFPMLGPTAFVLFTKPFSPDAAPRSVVVGHFAGLAAGFGVWQLVSFMYGEPVSLAAARWPTILSASLALGITSLLLVRLSCPHAPACATALVVALGAVSDWRGLLAIALGVLALTVHAVCVNRIVGLNTPVWSPYRDATSHP